MYIHGAVLIFICIMVVWFSVFLGNELKKKDEEMKNELDRLCKELMGVSYERYLEWKYKK